MPDDPNAHRSFSFLKYMTHMKPSYYFDAKSAIELLALAEWGSCALQQLAAPPHQNRTRCRCGQDHGVLYNEIDYDKEPGAFIVVWMARCPSCGFVNWFAEWPEPDVTKLQAEFQDLCDQALQDLSHDQVL